jgi:transcriptional regulator with XRE-family HTH domain
MAQMELKILKTKKVLGLKIRNRREGLGIETQQDLCDKILEKYPDTIVDRSRVSKWETGENSPKGKYIPILCDILDVDREFFDTISVEKPAKVGEMSPDELIQFMKAKHNRLSEIEVELLSLFNRATDKRKNTIIEDLRIHVAKNEKLAARRK